MHRELKRCKNCLVFSGADVAIEVECGSQTRVIRSDILDKDMFDHSANTPKHTPCTMQLWRRLDEAVGPGVMARPMFPMGEGDQLLPQDADPTTLESLRSDKYDGLCRGAPDKPSDLYHFVQVHPPTPAIRLVSSTPVEPNAFVAPKYPLIAKLAHVEGSVSFTMLVDSTGSVRNLSFGGGPLLLPSAVKNTSSSWKLPETSVREVHAVIEFSLNCLPQSK